MKLSLRGSQSRCNLYSGTPCLIEAQAEVTVGNKSATLMAYLGKW